ncbi:MAG: fatty acid desaturase [Polyangiaceae bacterium]
MNRAAVNTLTSRIDSWLAGFVNDPRDVPFVRLSALATFVTIPGAITLYVPGVFRWWLAGAYAFANIAFFLDRFILMLHNTSHRPLYKRRYRWMNYWIPWVLGPFYGETPETYYAHHVGMHHVENNLAPDLSSTMRYRRDSKRAFFAYYARFMIHGLVSLAGYLGRKNRRKLLRRMLAGEVLFWTGAALLFWVNWRATLVVFVVPVIVVRFLMMAGNWGQHAFVCRDQPANHYRNSITVIRCAYNDRCFNDGYHIGHHVSANRHWTEMPSDFEANVAEYVRHGALVFEGIDFFGVWARLMMGRYASLAHHYVALGDARPSDAAIVELLKSRTRPILT